MTLEEAIHYAEEVVTWSKDYKRLRELELQPCEQQPCDDAISRQAVMDLAKDIVIGDYKHRCIDATMINDLPSVTPTPKGR